MSVGDKMQPQQMTTAQALGLPVPFRWTDPANGVAWDLAVAPLDFEMEGMMEARLEAEQLEFCRRHRAVPGIDNPRALSALEFATQMSEVRRDAAAGAFAFDGFEMFKYLLSSRGKKFRAYLSLKRGSPHLAVTEGLVEAIWRDGPTDQQIEALKRKGEPYHSPREELEAVIEAANDPNRSGAPATPSPAPQTQQRPSPAQSQPWRRPGPAALPPGVAEALASLSPAPESSRS